MSKVFESVIGWGKCQWCGPTAPFFPGCMWRGFLVCVKKKKKKYLAALRTQFLIESVKNVQWRNDHFVTRSNEFS